MFYALHRVHHSRRPGTIWLHVGLSDWLLRSCQAECLSHLYLCRVVRLTALKLSCWLPYSWANQCCPVHMTHYSTLTTTAPVLHNRSREWFSQQASGPLQSFLYISRPDQAERMGNFIPKRQTDLSTMHSNNNPNGQQPNRIDFYIQDDHLLDPGEVSQENFSILLSLDSSDGETFPKKVFS